MIKPTTEDCISWLDREISGDPWPSTPAYDKKMNITIRSQLIAAREMAKALKRLSGGSFTTEKQRQSALVTWREAGGE